MPLVVVCKFHKVPIDNKETIPGTISNIEFLSTQAQVTQR